MSRSQGQNPPQAPQQRRPQGEYDPGVRQPAPPGWRPTQPPGRTPVQGGLVPQAAPQYAPQQQDYQQPQAGNGYGYADQSPQLAPEPPQFQWTPGQPPPFPAQQPASNQGYADDPYGVPPSQPSQAAGRAPRQPAQPAYAQPPRQPVAPPQQPQLQQPQLGGYDEPAGYDLGSYAAPANPRYAQRPQQPRQAQPQLGDPAGRWAPEPAVYETPQHNPAHLQQHLAPNAPIGQQYAPNNGRPLQAQAYGADYGYDQPEPANHRDDHALAEQDYEQDDGEYETEPRPRRRWLIVVALIASIGVGGGMAYAYKTMFAAKPAGPTQVVKAATGPVRTAPDTPGGKKVPNADNKFMNRLDGENAGDVDASGVRRVQTVVVGSGAAASAPSQPPRTTGVPGMTIVGPDSGPVAGGLAQVSPAAIPRAVAPLPSPAGGGAPRFAAQPQPSAQPAAPRAPQGQVMANVGGPAAMPQFDGEPAAKPAVKTVVPPKQPVKKANPATPSAQPGAVAKPRPGGFVAVLGYQRSQIEAMKMLADLQQKYDVLRDKRLDVVESDQSARGLGTIYRVVVGPAGGGEAARNLCAQLVAAGHPKADCYTLSN